jgi:hypothetical protein
MAPHGSLSLRASLRGQSAVISSVHELFVAAVFRDQSGKHLVARSPALGALDPEHIELPIRSPKMMAPSRAFTKNLSIPF